MESNISSLFGTVREIDDRVFEHYKSLIYHLAGIVLTDDNRSMVEGRIQGRMRTLGLGNASEYLQYVNSNLEKEQEHLINALTTNMTAFFREKHHFDYLAQEIKALVYKKGYISKRKIRVWSAGCSTGEEAYSIAMTIKDAIPDLNSIDCKILATDIDSNVLREAVKGVYESSKVNAIPDHYLNKWFVRGKGQNAHLVRVKKELRDMISFKKLNLNDEWPLRQKYDFVFCRNVLIYFSESDVRKILEKISELLSMGGKLLVGHSENVLKYTSIYDLVGNSIYEKSS